MSSDGHNNKRPRASRETLLTEEPIVFDRRHDVDGIKAHYDFFGYVIVRVLDTEEQCIDAIADQVKNILHKQPWVERLVVKDRETGEVLDIDRNRERFVKELTTPDIPSAVVKHYENVWPLHKGFGACCDPNAFHLKTMWDVRQDGDLYEVARNILGTHVLYTDINRCIQKLPGMGDAEFLHWDVPIFGPRPVKEDQLCGKVMFTDGSFICVPGTHTTDFVEEFKAAYGHLYPTAVSAQKHQPKFGLDPKKADPLDLRGMRQTITVPAGCAIFWSPYLLHGTEKSKSNSGIAFGMYLGYMTDIDRAGYRAKGGERWDRVDSYTVGRAPAAYPSLDPTQYYPKRYDNFPRMLVPYVEKTPADYKGRAERVVKSGPMKGTAVPILVPVLDPQYVPAPLSALGRRLLGVDKW